MVLSMVKGKARAAGSFLGGLANNPAIVIIALVLGGLIIFRGNISDFFKGLKFPEIPPIELPAINFPPFPEINFPEFPEIKLPDFSGLFEGFQSQLDELFKLNQSIIAGQTVTNEAGQEIEIPPDTVVNPDGTVSSETPPIVVSGGGATFEEQFFATTRAGVFDTLVENLGLSPTQAGNIVRGSETIADLERILFEANQGKFTPQQPQQTGGFDVPFNDPTGLGGGVSFIGGTTTFGSGIVDTLSEVLTIFPNLTASQAANALFANPDLTKNEFAQITPFQSSISSAGGDPDQIFNNASGGFSGLTAQQIANILTGGNISNF